MGWLDRSRAAGRAGLALQPLTLPIRLRRFLAGSTGLSSVPAELEASLASREERFLAMVRAEVFTGSTGPYRQLFRHAGCDLGDLIALVRSDGLRAALGKLAQQGVYLTAAEVRGRQDVVRGSLRLRVEPASLSLRGSGLVGQSSGSAGSPQRGASSFEWLAEQSLASGAFVLAHGLESHRFAAYEPALPGVAGMMYMLMLARRGIATDRWFAMPWAAGSRAERAFFGLLAAEMAWIAERFGPGFDAPRVVPTGDPGAILDWVAANRRDGRSSVIRTVASNSARIARQAIDRGVDLEGLMFLSSGEPMTPGKRSVIEQAGARTTVSYGFEPGCVFVGHGCARPSHVDEMHVATNTLELVESPHVMDLPHGEVRPLLFTTVHRAASRLLINVESGDYARLASGDCGCRLHRLGFTLRIHSVRSYEKLTGEGLAYPASEITEILEHRLPEEFGGGPCDYQLVEEEAEGAHTRLTLLVHPAIGPVDEPRLLRRLIELVGDPDHRMKFISEVWRREGTFRVLRAEPRTSSRGKTPLVVLAVGRDREGTREARVGRRDHLK